MSEDRPTFFSENNYTGTSVALGVGKYPTSSKFAPLANDSMSSLRVPAGYEVLLYQDAEYSGKRRTFREDVPELSKHDFNDCTSSLEVKRLPAAALKSDGKGGYTVDGATDEGVLKTRIASDPTVIHHLAHLAKRLGFAWCQGTDYAENGKGFDIVQSKGDKGTQFLIEARHYKGDKHYEEPNPDIRLKMILFNFRVFIDPATLVFGVPRTEDLRSTALVTKTVENLGGTEDLATVEFHYQLGTATSHQTTYKYAESTKWSVGGKVGFPIKKLAVEFSAGYEKTFTDEYGWTDGTEKTETEWLKHIYAAKVPARHRREVTLHANKSKASVDYTGTALIGFDIAFEGYLKWDDNARVDAPRSRPPVKVVFGTDALTGTQHVLDMYENRTVPAYSEWNWDVAEKIGKIPMSETLAFLRAPIRVPLSGTFSGVKQTTVNVVANEPVPLHVSPKPPAGPWKWEHVPLDGKARDIAIGADGVAWACTDDSHIYWRHATAGSWNRAAEYRAERLSAQAGSFLWMVNPGGTTTRVYHNRHSADKPYEQMNPGADPGTADRYPAKDVAVGADGTAWIVGGSEFNGNRQVLKWKDQVWVPAGGEAAAISVDVDGIPWISSATGEIYAFINEAWTRKGTGAADLSWSPGPQRQLWAINPAPGANGAAVRRWNGTTWDDAPAGDAFRIAVDPDGMPWRVDSQGQIHRLVKG